MLEKITVNTHSSIRIEAEKILYIDPFKLENEPHDGDIVFIHQQDYVDDGTVAAVLIDDEATLKRVYHLADGRIELRAANARYAPIIIGGANETRSLRILGKAIAFQSNVI